ncbi:MAG: bifunctional 4-hydroxy-2-oxoglutarate aldolase/2-dehydro-3-deoxy-phosphogluconate aldolase [Porticoccaceae bacterium]|nr:bifunctional 4-hydroxy-2-oxoglutarate aldolase/2-dehydro-3-deoxy-phosphogluconate aldolase [Porticoccaceae bacterium]
MRNLLTGHSVIPVITLDRVEDAVPLAEALVAGGIKVLEVTLRTEAAVEGIRQIVKHVPEAIVGTGTVCTEQQIKLSEDLGCQFMISPGATENLLQAGERSDIPFLPGISSVSELMRGMEYGYRNFKFFPAEAAGGPAVLKAMAGPFGDIGFCPTGGIGLHNAMEYLALPNVLCVGGSWIAQTKLINEQRWSEIETLAREACGLTAE